MITERCSNLLQLLKVITPENATTEIPRLINAAIQERRPVHLHLPIDVALAEIEVSETFQPEDMPHQDVKNILI